MRSKGVFGQLTGGRAHFIIPDDVETPNTAETVGMREKLLTRVTVELPAILSPVEEGDRPSWIPQNGIKYLGTAHHLETIYDVLPKRGKGLSRLPTELGHGILADKAHDMHSVANASELGQVIAPSPVGAGAGEPCMP